MQLGVFLGTGRRRAWLPSRRRRFPLPAAVRAQGGGRGAGGEARSGAAAGVGRCAHRQPAGRGAPPPPEEGRQLFPSQGGGDHIIRGVYF